MRRARMSIGDVAKIMGVTPATIRSWESRYGWPRPIRTTGAHRRYEPDALECFYQVGELRREMPIRQVIEHLELGVKPRQTPLAAGEA